MVGPISAIANGRIIPVASTAFAHSERMRRRKGAARRSLPPAYENRVTPDRNPCSKRVRTNHSNREPEHYDSYEELVQTDHLDNFPPLPDSRPRFGSRPLRRRQQQ